MARKHVKGRALDELLGEGRGDAEAGDACLAAFEQVCRTMDYAHSRGVVHGALRTSCVRVGRFGETQVVDWGAARTFRRGGTADEAQSRPEEHDLCALGAILEAILESSGSGAASESRLLARARSRRGASPTGAANLARAVSAHRAEARERAHRFALESAEARAESARAERETLERRAEAEAARRRARTSGTRQSWSSGSSTTLTTTTASPCSPTCCRSRATCAGS